MVVWIVVAVVVIAAVAWMWGRPPKVSRDLDKFAAARAMTSRWASDPSTSPKPVQDIAARDLQPIPAQRQDDGTDTTT